MLRWLNTTPLGRPVEPLVYRIAAMSVSISLRQVTAITYHDRFGQVARNTVVPEMLAAA